MIGTPGNAAWALEQAFYFFSLKTGSQDTGQAPPLIGEEDQYLQTIAEMHGNPKEDRLVNPLFFSFDFYVVSGVVATGVGIELNRYNKIYSFDDQSKIQLEAQGVLYGFTTYYRGDFWFPYFTIGSGGYNVKIREKLVNTAPDEETTQASFIDSAPNVLYYEIGSRFPFGEWGLLVAWRATAARLKVETIGKDLELGGQTVLLGGYFTF